MRVVAALLWRGEQVLVQQRSPDGSRPLLWEFPGGKVETGETDAAALERECLEELGVTVSVGPRAWETEHAYDDLTVHLVLYHASLPADAVPAPRQAVQLAWHLPAALTPLEFCAADVPVIADLVAGRLHAPF